MIEDIKPGLAEAGKIKIGMVGDERTSKAGSKWRPPKKVDHMRVTTLERDETGNFALDTAIMAALPKDRDGKVRRIPVQLPFDRVQDNWHTAYAAYSGRTLSCSGNGVEATRYQIEGNKRTGKTKKVPCTCPYLEQRKCKPTGRLSVMIDVPGMRLLGAAHVWRTTSAVSVSEMTGSLMAIHRALGGRLAGAPLWLVTREVPNEHGNFWCLHLELRESDVGVRAAIAAPDAAPMPTIEALTEAQHAEIVEEFYPEQNAR